MARLRCALVIAVVASSLVAQCPPPAWMPSNFLPGVNGSGKAVTSWDPDGAGPAAPLLVAGGSFVVAGSTSASNVVAWNGSAFVTLGSGVNGPVNVLTTFGGDLIAAGEFTQAGGNPANRIARWNGSSWQPMGAGFELPVLALATFNGELYAGGVFVFSGGTMVNRIARWDGAAWQPLGSGVTEAVRALATHAGKLVLGGYFDLAGGLPVHNIASWDGASWQTYGNGFDSSVDAIVDHGGSLYVQGGFTSTFSGGVELNHVARWDGAAWQPLGSGETGYITGAGALVSRGGVLVAGGAFNTVGGVPANRVASWNGAAWSPVGNGVVEATSGSAAYVHGLCVHEGDLFAAGAFSSVEGIPALRLARWNGSVWSPLGAGIDRWVHALTIFEGDLVAGGRFFGAGGVAARGVARWNGATWQPIGSGIQGWTNVDVTKLLPYAGGLVASGNAPTPGTISFWNGATWQTIGSIGSGSLVYDMVEFNGEVVICGTFSSISGTPISRIARWNGTTWQPLGAGLPWFVNALTVWNGELVAGGQFTIAAGAPSNFLARWNGSAWLPLPGPDGYVNALMVHDGDLIVGGPFPSAGGVTSTGIARFDGTSWHAFGNVGNTGVRRLGTFGGKIVAKANLWALPTQFTEGLALWDGVEWHAFGAGLTNQEPAAFVEYDGDLFVAGDFLQPAGIASPYLVRWGRPSPHLRVSQPGGAGTGIVVGNFGLIPGHEYVNVASLELCVGGPGTGPWGGLCASDPMTLIAQALQPVGTEPFHYLASGTSVSFGPYALPAGLALEVLSVDFTGAAVGCLSSVVRHVVY
jgi:hypothetical protein